MHRMQIHTYFIINCRCTEHKCKYTNGLDKSSYNVTILPSIIWVEQLITYLNAAIQTHINSHSQAYYS